MSLRPHAFAAAHDTQEKSMSTPTHTTAIGVFEKAGQAQQAVDALRDAGFADDQIGFVVRHEATESEGAGEGAATGAVTGGVVGGLLGAAAALLLPGIGPVLAGGVLAATLGGAALGATTGGLIGALAGMGVPEEEARYYWQEFETGRTIVTVEAGERYADAMTILRRYGGYGYADRERAADRRFDHLDSPAAGGYSASVGLASDPDAVPATAGPGAYAGGVAWEDVGAGYRRDFEARANRDERTWEQAEPGYRYGHALANDPAYQGRRLDLEGPALRERYRRWADQHGYRVPAHEAEWEQLRQEIRAAWDLARRDMPPQPLTRDDQPDAR
jgi:hypothetical protein